MNVDKAIRFVRARGTDIERARMASILWNRPAPEGTHRELAAVQHTDGGFSYWIPQTSSSCDTAHVLQWLDDLDMRDTPLAHTACHYLLDRQLPDGGWDEAESIAAYDPPGWLLPGRIETRVWLTGFVSHMLIRFGYVEPPGSRCPSTFLLAHCDESGRLAGYGRATWLALPMLALYPGRESDAFKRTLSAAMDLYTPDHDAWHLGWLLRCLSDCGLPAGHPLVIRSLGDLARKQHPDGRWSSEEIESVDHDVNVTITALRAVKKYGHHPPMALHRRNGED